MILTIESIPVRLVADKAAVVGESLVLADTHFGKSATFRARGIPVPEGDTVEDTARIRALLERHDPRRLVIAGDFLHAPEGKTPEVVEVLDEFFHSLRCEVHLVLGNHDRRSGSLPSGWPVVIHDRLDLGDVSVVHDPRDAPDGIASICGHLHPVLRIRDSRHTRFRAPCFWWRARLRQLILPSFGTFTGGQVVHPEDEDRLFSPLRDHVAEIPAELL